MSISKVTTVSASTATLEGTQYRTEESLPKIKELLQEHGGCHTVGSFFRRAV
jgi:hypothetical protein